MMLVNFLTHKTGGEGIDRGKEGEIHSLLSGRNDTRKRNAFLRRPDSWSLGHPQKKEIHTMKGVKKSLPIAMAFMAVSRIAMASPHFASDYSDAEEIKAARKSGPVSVRQTTAPRNAAPLPGRSRVYGPMNVRLSSASALPRLYTANPALRFVVIDGADVIGAESLCWKPFPARAGKGGGGTIIGARGPLGASAAGLAFSRVGTTGDGLGGAVAFDSAVAISRPAAHIRCVAGTPTAYQLTPPDTLRKLAVMNPGCRPWRIIGQNGMLREGVANGAYVLFDRTGRVAQVLVYQIDPATRTAPYAVRSGNALTLRGRFLMLADARTGVNRIPQGASEARFDVQTGAVILTR